jgi:hypothetical protein
MRHDPAAGAIVIMLRSLKMYGMAQAVTDLIEQGAPAFEAAVPMLSQLLKAELAEREVTPLILSSIFLLSGLAVDGTERVEEPAKRNFAS